MSHDLCWTLEILQVTWDMVAAIIMVLGTVAYNTMEHKIMYHKQKRNGSTTGL